MPHTRGLDVCRYRILNYLHPKATRMSSSKGSAPDMPLAIEQGSSSHTVTVGGDAVKLDQLGPIVLNKDGTMSRVNNWAEMTEPEKCATKRMIAKRNLLRKEELQMEQHGK